MTLRLEIQDLRKQLKQLAKEAETGLAQRYALRLPPRERMSLYRRLRMIAGRLLRWLGLRRSRMPEPWLAGLKHVEQAEHAKPFVIWALGADRDTLRVACRGFARLQGALPGRVPVLVTDIADFAFFSRLGWLVEYVPAMSAPALKYGDCKRRYVAWRYRDAPALPVSVGLKDDVDIKELIVD